eukprot:448008-Amphidinium_carterae.2
MKQLEVGCIIENRTEDFGEEVLLHTLSCRSFWFSVLIQLHVLVPAHPSKPADVCQSCGCLAEDFIEVKMWPQTALDATLLQEPKWALPLVGIRVRELAPNFLCRLTKLLYIEASAFMRYSYAFLAIFFSVFGSAAIPHICTDMVSDTFYVNLHGSEA